MQSKIAAIDKAKDIQTLWALTLEGLAESGIDHVIYLTVNSDFGAPFALTNRPDIYATLQPQDDPFLAHCCRSYAISFTGYEFLSEHAYLPDTARDFIKDAAAHGFLSGLGIPMRLEGSQRFGGFNLGTGLSRAQFNDRIAPKAEALRFFCLIAHRRIEELAREQDIQPDPAFRDLKVAPGFAVTADLSARESELIYLVASGLSRKECARMCEISPHTVSDYLKSAYRKLGVKNRAEAAQLIWRKGD
jgi:DNA-binding CsgD family transcriptional regulator